MAPPPSTSAQKSDLSPPRSPSTASSASSKDYEDYPEYQAWVASGGLARFNAKHNVPGFPHVYAPYTVWTEYKKELNKIPGLREHMAADAAAERHACLTTWEGGYETYRMMIGDYSDGISDSDSSSSSEAEGKEEKEEEAAVEHAPTLGVVSQEATARAEQTSPIKRSAAESLGSSPTSKRMRRRRDSGTW